MRNIKLIISYDGTDYSGWQFQKNSRNTVQAILQRAIRKITGEKCHVTGSGRTDDGVHAAAQVANFRTRSGIPAEKMRMALNSAIPEDIVIEDARDVDGRFDAQRSAVSKLYRYTIMNSDFMDPFLRRYAAKVFFRLDIARMRRGARQIIGRHDFRAFKTVDGGEKDSVRTVKDIRISKKGDIIYIDMEADGFLYNMARSIAGTLVEIGRGKFPVESMRRILRARDRRLCGPTMPAKGLCLIKVRYR